MVGPRVIQTYLWLLLGLWFAAAPVHASGHFARWAGVYEDARVRGSTALAQTPDGFLWVGSESGLIRFDGLTWYEEKGFSAQPFAVNDLLVDPRGRLWVASANTLLWRQNGTLQVVATLPEQDAQIRRLRWIGGAVYLAARTGVYRFDPVHGLVRLGSPDRFGAYDIAVDVGDKGLLAVNEGGVFVWRGAQGWQRRSLDAPGQLVTSMQRDAHGTLWLGGYTLRALSAEGREGPSEGPAKRIRKLLLLRNGELWVATHSNGIYIRSRDGHWRAGSRRLHGEMITALLEDSVGNVWVAAGTGLHRFVLSDSEWITTADGLPTTLIASVATEDANTTWVATYGNGLLKVDEDRRVQPVSTPCGEMLLSLAWQAPQTLWLGGETGLCRYQGGRVERLPDVDEVQSLAVASDGGLWALNRKTLFHLTNGVVDRRVQRLDPERLSSVFYMQDAGDGSVWLASGTGVARVDRDGWHAVDQHGEVDALLANSPNYAWLLQAKNLVLLMQDGQRYVQPALSGAWLLWRDAAGNLWQIGRKGKARVNEQRLYNALRAGQRVPAWEQFAGGVEQEEGVPPSQIGTPSIAAVNANRVAIAALGQVRIGSLVPASAPQTPPQVEVLSVSSAEVKQAQEGQKFAFGDAIQIRFVAANLQNPQALRFRYRILPITKAWSQETTERGVSFAQLPPGRYLFEVRACLPGAEGKTPARVTFSVLPRWYQLGWVRLLGVFALLVMLGAAITLLLRWRVRRLVARKYELEREVRLRTSELQEANRRLAELASTDTLTGIANRRAFHDACQQAWAAVQTGSGSLAVLMIDVDYFKPYNDTHGHAAGDEVLRSVAQTLRASVQAEEALVARYGGEEFVVLLPRHNLAAALPVAEGIRKAVEALAIPHHGRKDLAIVTVSIGAAASTLRDEEFDAVLTRADMALYTAKSSGRNWVCGD